MLPPVPGLLPLGTFMDGKKKPAALADRRTSFFPRRHPVEQSQER
jgi:hypothetical protein